ncbi:MAG: DEAD/DEAH box helicase [Burkholderiales bacterium]
MAHSHNVLTSFHPAVRAWFEQAFAAPTPAQIEAWPAIQAGRHVLVAAPTGSGKTLAAFLAAIDGLVRLGLAGGLADETHLVYVSPLKALSNDIQKNLEVPLAGIREHLKLQGLPDLDIRTWVRTGDTPQSERDKMKRRPPHILVTTPESLYILVTSASGRKMLATTRAVIVDEIHALAPNKRGVHLALTLERLEALTGQRLVRIGLSATQKPIETVARFLVGDGVRPSNDLFDCGEVNGCTIINAGHVRERDLAIELPASPLSAVMSLDVWQEVYARLTELILLHKTTLVFVNTRRMAERVARYLSERLGKEAVTAHHGSMAKEQRLDAEQRLKRGELKALVATASLELGIDIGDVDLVCQLGSPHSIAAFLQRVGRSGHAVGALPKGRLFPQSRDDLVECAALLDAVRREELDHLVIPDKPLDVLAQQIAAEVALQNWHEDELFALFRRAYPYRDLSHEEFLEIVRMLADGYATRQGRSNAFIHRDAVNHVLHGRRGAALSAVTCGGTIPDNADYNVVLEPEAIMIGTVNEDFAIESMAGDIFQLGNQSYQIMRVERGTVRVEDAHGAPPSIPFWLGEGPARSDALTQSVSRLRDELAKSLDEYGYELALARLSVMPGLTASAAEQIVEYLAAAKLALTTLPTQDIIVFERFFDESGGMQLVIHSPFGSRINRAWGLSLRKRFCRQFNFELQAAATEDAIILSLSTRHSFPLAEVACYLHSSSVRDVLVQALLAAPMFAARWRWTAAIALALLRYRGGKKVPPQLQRMAAEDLIAALFPDQIACAENIVGNREIPDHPLVRQTIDDCLRVAMDIDGFETLLRRIESGEVKIVARDTTEPSPLALEILSARPYTFLDDAPLEERRTQAVASRRWLDPQHSNDLGQLDAAAIERVRQEVWPEARDADELHDALLNLGFLTDMEVAAQPDWTPLLATLATARRATRIASIPGEPHGYWVAAERLPEMRALFASALLEPLITAPEEFATHVWAHAAALIEILHGRLAALGPVTAVDLAASLQATKSEIGVALIALETEGVILRGRFTPGATQEEWCERRLLARVHRYTLKRLRQEIEPVAAKDFLRFLFWWQRVDVGAQGEGPDAVATVLSQLEGFEAPAGAWEPELLSARIKHYDPAWLDDLSLSGRVAWMRLTTTKTESRPSGPVRATPIAILSRRNVAMWAAWARPLEANALSSDAQRVEACLFEQGASFFDEIVATTGLLRTQAEAALGELVAQGLINADSFGGLRALIVPTNRRRPFGSSSRRRRGAISGIEDAGRWSLLRRAAPSDDIHQAAVEHVARTLLKRYGVLFWRLLAREADGLPPWRELLKCYRRLEARGEIRGGRFVAGMSGEQFALPEAIGGLRDVRRKNDDTEWAAVSGADPLNLVGILTPGAKLPAIANNRVLYRGGIPVAIMTQGEIQFLETLAAEDAQHARDLLLRRPAYVPAANAEFQSLDESDLSGATGVS